MKKIITLLLIFFSSLLSAQNVGVGTTAPSEKLEVRNALRSTLKISSNSFLDTSELYLSNRDGINQGTDFSIKHIREQGLFFSSLSDLPANTSPNSLVIKPNGNIGMGSANPGDKLSVNGNINVSGTIKANGVDGAAGQVLMKNSSGNLAWGDMCEYKNFVTLSSPGIFSPWSVPAGVTKILIEAWGAGGGGNLLAAGGGGGYVRAYFTVSPGDVVQYFTGIGGAGAVSATATSGQPSAFQVGGVTINATAGAGALFLSATNGQSGPGGGFTVAPASFSNYIGLRGRPGESQERKYYQYDATTYYESGKAGRGGNAANTDNTGGLGQTYLYNTTGTTLVFRNGNPAGGTFPGGGGASGIQYGISTVGGGAGADGTVIIHY